MTVAELIEELQKQMPHREVIFESEDGIWRVVGVDVLSNMSLGCAVKIVGE